MSGKVDSKVLLTGMIILGAIIISFGIMNSLQRSSGYNTITAYGEGSVEALPDYVVIYFNVQTTRATAGEANDDNAEIVNKMKHALIVLGFLESDIKTSGFSVYPTYDYSKNNQEITGYTATHSVSLKLDLSESNRAGEVIDAGVGAGAGINYIGYELTKENQNVYKAEAIEAATIDAKNKAEALASGAEKRLGRIVSLSTDDSYWGGPWIAYSATEDSVTRSGAEIATNINPSEQEVSARVTLVYEIR